MDVTKSAKYFNLCIDGTAIATVADSFGALEQRGGAGRGRISWEELYRHLKSDFQEPGGGAGAADAPGQQPATAAGTPSATTGR